MDGALFGEELFETRARDELVLHHVEGAADLHDVRDDLGDVRRCRRERAEGDAAAQNERERDAHGAHIPHLLAEREDAVVFGGEPGFLLVEGIDALVVAVELVHLRLLAREGTHDTHGVDVLLHRQIDGGIALADLLEEQLCLFQIAHERGRKEGRDGDGEKEKPPVEHGERNDGEHDDDDRIEDVEEHTRIQLLEGDGIAVHRGEELAYVVAGERFAVELQKLGVRFGAESALHGDAAPLEGDVLRIEEHDADEEDARKNEDKVQKELPRSGRAEAAVEEKPNDALVDGRGRIVGDDIVDDARREQGQQQVAQDGDEREKFDEDVERKILFPILPAETEDVHEAPLEGRKNGLG